MYAYRCSTLFQLICLAIILGCARAKVAIIMKRIECLNYVPQIIQNLNCWVNRTSHSKGTFSMEFSLTKEVKDITGNFTISLKRGSIITKYLSIKVEYCTVLRSIQSNYAFKIILAEMRRAANFPLECPLKMNKLYSIKEFALDTQVLPSYVPEVDFISTTEINHYDKQFGKVTIHGSLSRI